MKRALRLGCHLGSIALTLAVAACGATIYGRTDGRPVNARQFESDKAVCQGEVAKADNGSLLSPTDDDAVFAGCMAQRGWMPQRR